MVKPDKSRYVYLQMCHVHLVRAVLKNFAKKYQKEIASKLKAGLEDEKKMQELERRAYSNAADTIERFQFRLWGLPHPPIYSIWTSFF